MAERDAYYKLAGLIEVDDTYFGAPKLVKRSRGVAGKTKEDSVSRTDGRRAYGVLNSGRIKHQPVVVRSGKNAIKVLPWVHTLIANVKGNIRGVYHGVSPKHLSRYLSESCYRFNRRFWCSQMFD